MYYLRKKGISMLSKSLCRKLKYILIDFIGTLAVLYLFIFVIVKSYSWGINMSAPTIEGLTDYSEFYKNTFPATSGMLTLSMFIHNIIITIMRNNENQKHNASNCIIIFTSNTNCEIFSIHLGS